MTGLLSLAQLHSSIRLCCGLVHSVMLRVSIFSIHVVCGVCNQSIYQLAVTISISIVCCACWLRATHHVVLWRHSQTLFETPRLGVIRIEYSTACCGPFVTPAYFYCCLLVMDNFVSISTDCGCEQTKPITVISKLVSSFAHSISAKIKLKPLSDRIGRCFHQTCGKWNIVSEWSYALAKLVLKCGCRD